MTARVGFCPTRHEICCRIQAIVHEFAAIGVTRAWDAIQPQSDSGCLFAMPRSHAPKLPGRSSRFQGTLDCLVERTRAPLAGALLACPTEVAERGFAP